MQPENRRKHAKLNPSCFQFVILCSICMAAYIMAPPAVPCIGGCCGKIGLISKGFPADDGIARK